MQRVRITVKRMAWYDDLIEQYENPIEDACSMELGQTFIAIDGEKPEDFCDSAWETLSPFVKTLAEGGGDFYDGWMKNPKSALLSCNDGFRPVSFLIEAMDEVPVISVAEMRDADKYTIEKGTPSKELMRRAAQGIFDAGDSRGLWQDKKTLIICGSGNNGGDGYALAEIMQAKDCDVTLLRASEKFSDDGGYYYERCKAAGVKEIELSDIDRSDVNVLCDYDVLVDCILGTGFTGTPREQVADVIAKINEAGERGAYVVSADINSGMNGDTGEAELAVKSNLTVSIGYYKHGFFRGQADELIGELVNTDIGIEMERPKVVCRYSAQNNQCIGKRCPFSAANETK